MPRKTPDFILKASDQTRDLCGALRAANGKMRGSVNYKSVEIVFE